ncbi:MAG: ankyrin repeat domain-containing protein [Alphaproteobacteria bacterium]|nr:ankyrin repeat domain-containing protein [Alphaproteobacteria bacterium]
MALTALELFASELDSALWDEATQAKLRKALPVIAVKRAQTGEEISAESLLADLRQGPDYFHELQRQYGKALASPKERTYDDVLEKLYQKTDVTLLGALEAGMEDKAMAHLERLLAEENRSNLPQTILDNALCKAAAKGFTKLVACLLEAGANSNTMDGQALLVSAEKGHLAVVDCLLDDGLNVRTGNDKALSWAAKNGHLEMAKRLLAAGAYIHALNDEAVRMAAESGHLEMVKLLRQAGADIHAYNGNALWGAAKKQSLGNRGVSARSRC